MATPKANNDHLFLGKYEFLQEGIYSSEEPMKSMDLTRIMQISSLSRLQGPFPAPSRMKNIQKTEFRAIPKLHPSDPSYHNEIISNFKVFSPKTADIQCADEGIKVVSLKFGPN